MIDEDGWDIREFFEAGGGTVKQGAAYPDTFKAGSCGSGGCQGTVTVHGECHWAAEVNYILWGKASRLCTDLFNRLVRQKEAKYIDEDTIVIPAIGGKGVLIYYRLTLANMLALIKLHRLRYYERLFPGGDLNLKYIRSNVGIGYPERAAWARVGWFGNYNYASDIKIDDQCAPCSTKYTGVLRFRIGNAKRQHIEFIVNNAVATGNPSAPIKEPVEDPTVRR
jgi:hypothetical protein